ncbi:protein TBATA isoform X1 [Bubalus bubalis]|uniref:protein TBATA isoform X1 n=1 Tax=Bubalus bubalis TaxID=89462 RepID=UPI000DBC7BA5|nr:protein TBATA isoform X1 [Bubalus bubalis]
MATEVRAQLAEHSLPSPKGEPNLEKKSGCQPRRHGDSGPQKEPMIPGIVDFKLIQEAVRTSKPQTPSAYRFGRLSHHSFFSRHHPQPQHVTHIQDLTGKPVCVVRDELSLATSPQATLLSRYLIRMPTISVPVGDPQSNRDPRLYSEGGASAGTGGKVLSRDWQAHPCFYPSHGPPPLPPGPKPACKQRWRRPDLCPTGSGAADPGTAFANSADRLLECYPVLATLRARQGERHGTRAPADRGGSAPSPAPSAHPSRKTPEPAPGSSRLTSREAPATLQPIPEEDEDTTSTKKRKTREHWKSSSSSSALQPEPRREGGKGRGLRSLRLAQEKPLSSKTLSLSPQQQYWFSYHVEPIKLLSSP